MVQDLTVINKDSTHFLLSAAEPQLPSVLRHRLSLQKPLLQCGTDAQLMCAMHCHSVRPMTGRAHRRQCPATCKQAQHAGSSTQGNHYACSSPTCCRPQHLHVCRFYQLQVGYERVDGSKHCWPQGRGLPSQVKAGPNISYDGSIALESHTYSLTCKCMNL